MTAAQGEPDATEIAIAVVEWRGRFLVGQRPAGKPLAGLYEFPGGHIEPNESPEEAAVRECREETGLDVQVVGAYPAVDHQYQHGRIRLLFFACCPIAPRTTPRPPFRWIDRPTIPTLEFPEANRAILQFLAARGSPEEHDDC